MNHPTTRARLPHWTAAALTLAACVTATTPLAAHATAAPAVPLELPHPTGPHAVGRDTLHLIDRNRPDPWKPDAGPRQLMVSMFYPAKRGTGAPAPYMTTEEARLLLQRKAPGAAVPPETISATRTSARSGARPAPGRYPLVVLSPGLTLPRATLTGLAEDLASRGHVVALVDHTYESTGTTFPDGRTLTCAVCDQPPAGGPGAIAHSRAKDVSFVIDQLTGRHPAWKRARMIAAHRIGMAGHSIGGAAASATMAADPRVRAGINMDGTFRAPPPATGLNGRPFLLLGTQSDHVPGKDDTWDRDWPALDGWKRWLTVTGAQHSSFTDAALLETLLRTPAPGELPARRALEITRGYVGAFFAQHLKGTNQPLLDGPSPANPEVAFHRP